MEKNLNMTQGRPLRLLVLFALPLMFGNAFQQLYTVVDTAIVGRGVGMDALAALGTVDWLNWMMLGVVTGYTQGFSVLVAQKFGEGDIRGMKKMLGQSAVLSVIISLIGVLIMQTGLPLFMALLRVPEKLYDMGALYSRILMGGLPVVIFYNYTSSVLRAIGDSKTPLIAMVAAALTNIILDCLAVFVLRWGIGGAAAATVLAQCLAGAICARKMWKTPELRFSREHLALDWPLCGKLMKLGTPIAAKSIIISVGGMAVQTIVNGFDISFIAGYTATNKLYGLLEICALSYGYAVTTYVGQNYGAAKYDRIRYGMRSALWLSIATSVVIGVAMILLGRPVVRLFITSDVASLALAAENTGYIYLCMMSIFLPVLYIIYIYQSALQGMGNSMISMLAGALELVARIGVAWLVSIIGYEYGIFGAEIGAWVIAAIYTLIYYHRWMKKNMPQTAEKKI